MSSVRIWVDYRMFNENIPTIYVWKQWAVFEYELIIECSMMLCMQQSYLCTSISDKPYLLARCHNIQWKLTGCHTQWHIGVFCDLGSFTISALRVCGYHHWSKSTSGVSQHSTTIIQTGVMCLHSHCVLHTVIGVCTTVVQYLLQNLK